MNETKHLVSDGDQPGRLRLAPRDRLLLVGVLVMQVVITVLLVWPRLRAEPPASSERHFTGREGAVADMANHPPQPTTPTQRLAPFLPSHQHGVPDVADLHAVMEARMDRMMAQAASDLQQMQTLMDMDSGWEVVGQTPALDMRDRGADYCILMSLAAEETNALAVTLDGRLVTIVVPGRGSRRRGGSEWVEKRIQLPGPVGDVRCAYAGFTNGLLQVVVPKGQGEESRMPAVRLL